MLSKKKTNIYDILKNLSLKGKAFEFAKIIFPVTGITPSAKVKHENNFLVSKKNILTQMIQRGERSGIPADDFDKTV